MIKNIIFDMDGTVLNTIDDLADSLNFALSANGYPTHGVERVKSFVGNGVRKLVERALPSDISSEEFDKCMRVFSAHYDKNKNNKTAPYDGILELMAELSARNIGMAIVSNKYDAAVKALTNELFGKYIKVAIGESETTKPKPAPDGVWKAMDLLSANKSDTVYVGDSDVDSATANNSGLPFIAVTWGFKSREFLISIGAKCLADNPSEIPSIIEDIK